MKVMSRLVAGACLVGLMACAPAREADWLGPPDRVAPGVDFYRNNDPSLVGNAGPIAVFLVRVDPAAAEAPLDQAERDELERALTELEAQEQQELRVKR